MKNYNRQMMTKRTKVHIKNRVFFFSPNLRRLVPLSRGAGGGGGGGGATGGRGREVGGGGL